MKRIRILLLLLSAASAAQAQFTYTTNNGTITITQFADNGSAGDVTIPDTINGLRVTDIGPAAFFQCYSITSATIGTNVTAIGNDAFFTCPAMTSVSIPGSVTNFGLEPFLDCQSLTSMSFSSSNSFYTITNGVLFNKSVTSIIEFPGGVKGSYTLGAGVTNIGPAFVGNTLSSISVNSTNLNYASTNGVLCDKSLTYLINYPGGLGGTYTVPGRITNVVSASFEYSPGVQGVIIGTNVTSIGEFAFYDCTNLTAITVNSTNAFYSSTNGVLFNKSKTDLIQYPSGLAGSYVVPGTVTNLEAGAFGDAFGLAGIVIPNGVVGIGDETFYSCQNLASVTLGNHVASIGANAFYDCTSLQTITIPSTVTNIAEFAFFYCPDLASVTFGSGLASLGFEAFANCQSLSSVCFEGNQPADGGSVFYFDNALSTILYVNGTKNWGVLYDGITTEVCASCGNAPQLGIIRSGANVVVGWSDSFTAYTLQSNTNLASPSTWSTVSPAPADLNGLFVVTNSISGAQKFYRLTE